MADNGVPEWGASLRALVGAQGATLTAIQSDLSRMRATLEAHCARKNSDSWKKWGAFGVGIGAGLTGIGTVLAKLLGL